MNNVTTLFFGSTTDSVIVLEQLSSIAAVVTQPPRPVGRDKIVTPTPVETWAKKHDITTLSFPSNPEKPWAFADEQQVIDALEPIKADLLISASFGVKIPLRTIEKTPYGGVNIHPSLLPRWRGADPVPWAIMSGDHQIGVSITTLSQEFDKGIILAQKKTPILPTDTSDPLRTKLFTLGTDLLVEILEKQSYKKKLEPITVEAKQPYARKFTRQDGFEDWNILMDPNESDRINRKWRALHPWPGVWTTIRYEVRGKGYEEKRLKILKLHLEPPHTSSPIPHTLVLDEVQLEGKKPVSWVQFQQAYLNL